MSRLPPSTELGLIVIHKLRLIKVRIMLSKGNKTVHGGSNV